MNKRKAIKLLKEQKQIFIERSYADRDVCHQKTASLVKDFCGKNSDEYAAIANFEFGVWTRQNGLKNIDYALIRKRDVMIGLLKNCIDKVKRNGIQSSSESNAATHPATTAATKAGAFILSNINKIIIGVISGLLVLAIWALFEYEIINFFSH